MQKRSLLLKSRRFSLAGGPVGLRSPSGSC